MGNVTYTVHAVLDGAVRPEFKKQTEPKCLVIGTLTMSGSYATGGDTIDLSDFLEKAPDLVIIQGGARNLQFVAGANATNGKVLSYESDGNAGTLVETSNATDLDAVTAAFIAVGQRQLD